MLRTGLRGLGVTEDKMLGSGWGLWDGQQEAWSCAASRKKCGCRGHRESWAFSRIIEYSSKVTPDEGWKMEMGSGYHRYCDPGKVAGRPRGAGPGEIAEHSRGGLNASGRGVTLLIDVTVCRACCEDVSIPGVTFSGGLYLISMVHSTFT